MSKNISLAIIGGSGLYQIPGLTNTEMLEISTPFGPPSSPLMIGDINGNSVTFLARHGIEHTISPSEVNYRANIFALKLLGVQRILSISACGSLREDFVPGDIVIPDQLVDFTRDRSRSYFGDGLVVHTGVANPYCNDLALAVKKAAISAGGTVHASGTLITIEGPRFSTKGESDLYRSWGMSIIGMTACPEAFLAREAEMCYVTLAHVTDYDVWHSSEETVSVEMVIKTLHANTKLAHRILENLLTLDLSHPTCHCNDSLKDAFITALEKVPPQTIEKLRPIMGRYLTS